MALTDFIARRRVEASIEKIHQELARRTSAGNARALELASAAVETAKVLPSRDRARRTASLLLERVMH